jgi:YesN/AraC family two-component response regulator
MVLVMVVLLLKNRELMFGVVTVDTDEMLVEEKHFDLSPEEEMQTWFLINHYLSGHPYVQQQFNLQVMSKSIQLNGSIISTLIRKKYEKSFVEFRNDLRVEYAKNLMEQHLHKTQTLESIGRMSGFASRTTFFNSFKKSTGKNPSQFIEEMDC